MTNLDDTLVLKALDPKGMFHLTDELGNQCRRAYEIASSVEVPAFPALPGLIVLSGMGGSASGGDFVKAIFDERGAVPFIVNRDYTLPNYVGVNDLVICASYSGNTEETLAAYDSAKSLGAKIAVVTSGGKLAEKAQADGNSLVLIPGGQPPRTALGSMMVPVFVICEKLKALHPQDYHSAFDVLDRCRDLWGHGVATSDNVAKQLAQDLYGKLGILYGLGSYQAAIANRWRCQINENSKNLAIVNGFPELNHNEILGWVKAEHQGVAQYVGVILEDGYESDKMKARLAVTEELIKSKCKFHHVRAMGETLLERMLSLSYFGDYVSLYLALLNEVDPESIEWINVLKGELAKIG